MKEKKVSITWYLILKYKKLIKKKTKNRNNNCKDLIVKNKN